MKKFIAEFIGTATLVFFGCGSAVLAGGEVGQLGIYFAFGLAIVAMAYGIGPISGCHVNPAVSFGAFLAGDDGAFALAGRACGCSTSAFAHQFAIGRYLGAASAPVVARQFGPHLGPAATA